MLAGHPGSGPALGDRACDLVGLSRDDVACWRPLTPAVEESREPPASAALQGLSRDGRTFLFHAPGLPAALLPAGWSGHRTAEFPERWTARLSPAAGRSVERCPAAPPPAAPSP
ncbi:PaaX family transcriptional regulator C-terminal domain-containing protein [Actinoalloteichus spitiensis]|uniref:PaaX family transcriptional regulator C-terminal domain-containing protein n=1 Tax=Actinoalloteichus spitiensis TaxID=252394 RepID=UPI00035CEC85|nr:PaaX family transcriptional regulator C-terminal domain-containing protein [Actinoalloteichus spitiensis]